ncbi:MAG: NAD(P)/FAD-dependent oxidoreductase, partial [Turneriella sp.]|nr:NAD(P)/FAD-dependent oxidoreductase [Turneriella sp.]
MCIRDRSIPSRDSFSEMLRRFLPESWVFQLARARNIALQRLIYVLSRSRPAEIKRLIIAAAERHLAGTTDIRHFTPKYNPWDERLCVVPDGDLFKAIKAGRASVVTDHIETFTEKGIRLRSGQELEADIVVTATGLNVEMMGGVTVEVDGKPVPIADRLTYKAVLFEGVPNAAVIFGYTNSSWTLKVDLACEYICRLLRHMEKNRLRMFVAEAPPDERTTETVLGSLSSGYIRRAADKLPRQGKSLLWRVSNDYLSDSVMLRWLPITDSSLKFS